MSVSFVEACYGVPAQDRPYREYVLNMEIIVTENGSRMYCMKHVGINVSCRFLGVISHCWSL